MRLAQHRGTEQVEGRSMRLTRPTASGRVEVRPFPGWAFVAGYYTVVDLTSHFNNDGISHTGDIPDGDLNGEGMVFPAEVLPPSDEVVELCEVPFLFPDKVSGAPNNVCLEGQVIEVSPEKYRNLRVLGVSEGGSFEEPLELRYSDGRIGEVILGLTDCRPHWGKVRFGEQAAVRFEEMRFPPGDTHTCNAGEICGLWIQRLPVDERRELTSLEFGDNGSMHVFALTLRRAVDWTPPLDSAAAGDRTGDARSAAINGAASADRSDDGEEAMP